MKADEFFKELEQSFIPPYYPTVDPDVIHHANDMFGLAVSELYYGDLYVLPLTQDAEEYREMLYNVYDIGRYGAYEINFKYKSETYIAILVNND